MNSSIDIPLKAIDRTLASAEAAGYYGLLLMRLGTKTLLARACGLADRESSRPMTMETGIEIGSIVKPITLTALLRLQEMGKLDLADTLERHFPEAPADKHDITLDQIARHRAGFRDIFGGDYQLVNREWIVSKVLRSRLRYRPGEGEHYSNSGYSLLAALIEQVSGMPFETFVRQEALLPAGVERIGYVLAGWRNEDLAVGYGRFGRRWGTPLDHGWLPDGPGWNLRGNGGMLAAAADLAAWYQALWEGKVLGREALDHFLRIDAADSKLVGGKALAHAGGNGIFNCLQICYFAPGLYLTLFSSKANHKAERLWHFLRESVIAIAKAAYDTGGEETT